MSKTVRFPFLSGTCPASSGRGPFSVKAVMRTDPLPSVASSRSSRPPAPPGIPRSPPSVWRAQRRLQLGPHGGQSVHALRRQRCGDQTGPGADPHGHSLGVGDQGLQPYGDRLTRGNGDPVVPADVELPALAEGGDVDQRIALRRVAQQQHRAVPRGGTATHEPGLRSRRHAGGGLQPPSFAATVTGRDTVAGPGAERLSLNGEVTGGRHLGHCRRRAGLGDAGQRAFAGANRRVPGTS